MSNRISNLYAARIFAEHPIALWSLDDDFSFISQLSQSDKSISNWNLDNLTDVSASISIPVGVKLENEDSKVITLTSASVSLTGSASATAINTLTNLDPDKTTISINAFVYDFEGFVLNYKIGFIYNGSPSYTQYNNLDEAKWNKISHTMSVPSGNVDLYPYFEVIYSDASVNQGREYDVAINALSVGQWSELFHYESTGTIPVTISDSNLLSLISASSSLSSSAIKGVEADFYGISGSATGYYIIEKNKMLATSNNFPITFGATNITHIDRPLYGTIPSLVFSGQGFLNKSGQYKEITAEFWLRCFTELTSPIKIFGPISSKDGIYVEKDFISIKVGPYQQSYFIGKWYRPMLIDFRYSVETISLLINGDLVIQVDIDQNKIIFPESNNDYVGFYGSQYVHPFDLDSFAIYPYIVSEQIAKKRFIYAQGVQSADSVVSNFKGDSFQVDFPYANYTSTLSYPDMNDWNAGFFNNSNSTSKFLTSPNYSLPEIIFSEPVNLDDFLIDNYNIQESGYSFIKLKPNSNYNDITSSIYFKSLNVLSSPVKSIVGVFEAPETLTSTKETLIYISNNFNNNTFTINISNAGVEYFYNTTLIYQHEITSGEIFHTGFDLNVISQEYSNILGNFFSNPQNLTLVLGGNQNSVFTGKIFNLTFNNIMFTQKDFSNYILDNGFFDIDVNTDIFISYIGNYTFYSQTLSDSLVIDIGSKGYWEDSIPLSYFGKYVLDKNKNPYYDLDLLQFNIDSPSSLVLKKENYEILDGGLSSDLIFEIAFDSGLPESSSASFDLFFNGGDPETSSFTEYLTEEELKIAYSNYFINNQSVKTYITLQHFTDVGKIPYSQYVNIDRIGPDRVLDMDKFTNNDIETTKFEVNDRTIIFPPKELVDFSEYYITIHIEIQSKGINKNPVLLKKMSLASLAYDETKFYSISSPDGYKLYPFNRYGSVYTYKNKNPFTIYKDSTSYMHNTGDSGISVLPYESTATRGITVPINQQIATEYLLGGVQFWSFYNKDTTITETVQIGKISSRNKSYDIKLVPESNYTRAKMVLYDAGTTNEATGIIFYQNGQIVDNPYIQPLSWNGIIITFDQSINLANQVGQFEVYEGLMVNNIAFYKKSSDVLGNIFVDNIWQDLRSETTWGTWYDLGDWEEIEGRSEPLTFIVDGKSIYESTFGISSAVSRDNSTLLINSDGVDIITGTIWENYTEKPV